MSTEHTQASARTKLLPVKKQTKVLSARLDLKATSLVPPTLAAND